jgi:hypothetical protein
MHYCCICTSRIVSPKHVACQWFDLNRTAEHIDPTEAPRLEHCDFV